MKCSFCNIDNKSDAQFCRSCGRPLTTHNKAWWKEHNMEPVEIHKFKRLVWPTLLFIPLSMILAYFAFAGILAICVSPVAIYNGEPYAWCMPILGVVILGVVYMLSRYLYSTIGYMVFINKCKKKTGLLNKDYIQKGNDNTGRFVFFVRGTHGLHKFGLFDVKKFKIKLPPVYEELEWIDKGKLLNVLKDGERFVIDINGNKYK